MDIQCNLHQCKNKVAVKCICSRNTSFFCSDHFTSHLQSKGSHTYEKLLYSENPQRNEIITQAYSLIYQLSKSRSKILEEYQRLKHEIESQTEKILENLKELETLCENLVNSAGNKNGKDIVKNLYIDYILNLDFSMLCNELSSWQSPLIHINSVNLSKIFAISPLSSPFTHFPLSIEQSGAISLYELHPSSLNEIMFFKQNSKTRVTINVETCDKLETELNLPENMPYGAGIIEIPGGNMFHAGGSLGNPIGSCYLMKGSKIEKLQSFRSRSAPAVAYLDGKVYAVGGRDGKYVKDCEVFNLLTKEWKVLPPIPEASNGLSIVGFASQLLIAGYFHRKMFSFDTFTHAYAELTEMTEGNKVLTVGNGKGYILCNRKLYESNFGNIKEWNVVKDIPYCGGWCINHPIRVNNFIYFLADYSHKELWRFDLGTKDVSLMCKY